LAVVQKIVQDHGGEISVERTHGTTVFRIVLPGRVPQTTPGAGNYEAVNPSFVPVPPEKVSHSSISHPDA